MGNYNFEVLHLIMKLAHQTTDFLEAFDYNHDFCFTLKFEFNSFLFHKKFYSGVFFAGLWTLDKYSFTFLMSRNTYL